MRKNGRFCEKAPGPIESDPSAIGLKVILHTDHENVSSGFEAKYVFKPKRGMFSCKQTLTLF